MFDDDAYIGGRTERFYGKYRGKVADNRPDELGRIWVTCPSVLGQKELRATPCVPYAGKGVGFRFLPENGDDVWVEFEGGHPSSAIWSGCFWTKERNFPRVQDPANIKIIQTAKVTIEIDDEAGSITIEQHENGTIFKIEGNEISSVATTKITQQVKAMKTTLDVAKFDVHDGAMTVV